MIKKNDLILIGSVILISLVVILLINLNKKEGSKLVVTMDGDVYKTFDLNQDTTFTIKADDDEWNTFQIKDGYVKMLDANCPDKLCVTNFKPIHFNTETIVCLPHKVVLKIEGGEENEVDIIAN
jgi:hypothetical protein